MTNETAPERIWATYNDAFGINWKDGQFTTSEQPACGRYTPYIREDISEIRTERVIAELEAAQAHIAELEEVLRPFVAFQHRDHFDGHGSFDLQAAVKAHCKLKRIARAALEGKG